MHETANNISYSNHIVSSHTSKYHHTDPHETTAPRRLEKFACVRVVAVVDKDGVVGDQELEEQFIGTQQWRKILKGMKREKETSAVAQQCGSNLSSFNMSLD